MSHIGSAIPTSGQHECGFFQFRPKPTPAPRSCDPAPGGVPFASNPPGSPQPVLGPRVAWASVTGFGHAQCGGPHDRPAVDPSTSCRSPGRVRTHRPQPAGRDLRPLHAAPPARERPLSGSSLLLVHKVIEDGHPRDLKHHADATGSEPVAGIRQSCSDWIS